MALQHVPNRPQTYHLINFDKGGTEVPGVGGVLDSDAAIAALNAPGDVITDVFILSHGWQNSEEDAIGQYGSWLQAYNPDKADDDIRPLVIALHWPSKAWTDKQLTHGDNGLLADDAPVASDDQITVSDAVDEYAELTVDTEAARKALETILGAVAAISPDATATEGDTLPDSLAEAYATLFAEAGVGDEPADDVSRGPGADGLLGDADGEGAGNADAWDPRKIFADAVAGESDDETLVLGDGPLSKLREIILTGLRQLSFWTMKKRARTFGESGGSQLLRRIQEASPAVRVHLMGHSFGTVVVSGMVRGSGATPVAPLRPVDSMFLVQGAVSLWAFADDVPKRIGGGRGYFADVVTSHFAGGPIVVTRSSFDYAVGKFYPLAVRVSGDYLLAGEELPKYGGIGAFGIQGAGALELPALVKGSVTPPGPLSRGDIYNVDASAVIATVDGPGGAHSDLAHPELTRLAWAAALASRPTP